MEKMKIKKEDLVLLEYKINQQIKSLSNILCEFLENDGRLLCSLYKSLHNSLLNNLYSFQKNYENYIFSCSKFMNRDILNGKCFSKLEEKLYLHQNYFEKVIQDVKSESFKETGPHQDIFSYYNIVFFKLFLKNLESIYNVS